MSAPTNPMHDVDKVPIQLEERLEFEAQKFGSTAEEERANEAAVAERREKILEEKAKAAGGEVEHAKAVAAAHKAKAAAEAELESKIPRQE